MYSQTSSYNQQNLKCEEKNPHAKQLIEKQHYQRDASNQKLRSGSHILQY